VIDPIARDVSGRSGSAMAFGVFACAVLGACGGGAGGASGGVSGAVSTAPTAGSAPTPPVTTTNTDVLTYKNDLKRSGQNLDETALNPASVTSATFGLLRVLPVDGKVCMRSI